MRTGVLFWACLYVSSHRQAITSVECHRKGAIRPAAAIITSGEKPRCFWVHFSNLSSVRSNLRYVAKKYLDIVSDCIHLFLDGGEYYWTYSVVTTELYLGQLVAVKSRFI